MKMMRKLVLSAACAGGLYGLWQVVQSPQVDAVHWFHGRPNLILIRHFPLTQQGKIDWWDHNQTILKAKYGVSHDDYLTFMAWDGTYRVDRGTDEDSDLLCFEDMDTQANCIEKGTVMMIVDKQFDGGMRFTVKGLTGEATYVRDPDSDTLRLRPD